MTMRSLLLTLAVTAVSLVASAAFVPLPSFGTTTQSRVAASPLAGTSKDDFEKALKARTDVRIFLTQRSIQSFFSLLSSCRDPHTIGWIENLLGCKNLHRFHGTGGLNVTRYDTWDACLEEIMSQPPNLIIARAKRKGSDMGGWKKNYLATLGGNEGKSSKKNPYIKDTFIDFEIEIDPVSLAARIISVREQLAREWAHDLEEMIMANDRILESYHDRVMDERENEDSTKDSITAPYSEATYERMALGDSSVFMDVAPSPLRKENFDLMVLLATQESIHQVLQDYAQAGEKRQVSLEWLREFYTDRLSQYFDGSQDFFRADEFLDELLLTPPSVKKNEKGQADLIDPLRIAEDIIEMRTYVGEEWKEIMSQVPEDHTELRKVLLAKQMLKWGQTDDEKAEEQVVKTQIIEGGEFE